MSKFKQYLIEALIREAPLMKPDSQYPFPPSQTPYPDQLPGPNGLTKTPNWDGLLADCFYNGNCDNPCNPGEDCYKQWIIDTSGGPGGLLTPLEDIGTDIPPPYNPAMFDNNIR